MLVTGAGGYVGGRVARRCREAGHEVLTHGRAAGDLSSADPFSGITTDQRRRITHIVHSAAITRFDVDRQEASAVNVEGTGKVVALARRCPQLERLGILSTVYSTGLRSGPVTEQLYDGQAGFANDYEWSKWAAEQRVAEVGADLPWMILRAATIVADDESGVVTQHNAFHETLKLWFNGLLPLVPGDAGAHLYLVTGDFVANAVMRALEGGVPGRVYHLAHAAGDSLTLGGAIDVVTEAFDAVDAYRRRRVPRPLLGDDRTFALLAGGVDAFGGGLVRQSLRSVVPFARQLFVDKEIDNTGLRGVLGDGYRSPDPATLVRRTCEWLVDTGWGRHAVA